MFAFFMLHGISDRVETGSENKIAISGPNDNR